MRPIGCGCTGIEMKEQVAIEVLAEASVQLQAGQVALDSIIATRFGLEDQEIGWLKEARHRLANVRSTVHGIRELATMRLAENMVKAQKEVYARIGAGASLAPPIIGS